MIIDILSGEGSALGSVPDEIREAVIADIVEEIATLRVLRKQGAR